MPTLRSYLAHFLIVVVLKIQVISGGHLITSVIIVIRIWQWAAQDLHPHTDAPIIKPGLRVYANVAGHHGDWQLIEHRGLLLTVSFKYHVTRSILHGNPCVAVIAHHDFVGRHPVTQPERVPSLGNDPCELSQAPGVHFDPLMQVVPTGTPSPIVKVVFINACLDVESPTMGSQTITLCCGGM